LFAYKAAYKREQSDDQVRQAQ